MIIDTLVNMILNSDRRAYTTRELAQYLRNNYPEWSDSKIRGTVKKLTYHPNIKTERISAHKIYVKCKGVL